MKKNRMIHITLILFMMLSAFLMTIGTIVISQTSKSMEHLFAVAKPPHFLQMHIGDIDQNQINEFAKSVSYVKEEETVEMLNIDSASIWYERKHDKEPISMRDNMMDNGFVKQNKKFDFLLDLNNQVIEQKDGDIGVPVSYQSQYKLNIGDKVIISQGDFYQEYTITSFVRDSQMASTMASSTRFLLSDQDYTTLCSNIGELEYIIEFRFDKSSHANEFQKLYESKDVNMPKNGQAITYPLIKLVNSLSSGLLAGMLILISIVLMLIAALNLRFTILASLEEEIKDIGAMKAIGLSNKSVKSIYLVKYRTFAVIGCSLGYLIGLLLSNVFTKSVRTMFGGCGLDIKSICLPILTVTLVYLLIMVICRKILCVINRITVVQALVYGETTTKKRKTKTEHLHIRRNCKKHINLFLSCKELLQEKKSWFLIIAIFAIAMNVMLIPMNLIHTFSDDRIASNMGVAICDITANIHAKEQLEEKKSAFLDEGSKDNSISEFGLYAYCKYETMGEEGKEPFLMECGDFRTFSFHCMEGREPKEKGEIAISYLNHEKLNKNVGDELVVTQNGQDISYQVCGIYQDITSGGFTAKAYADYEIKDVQDYTVYINLKDKGQINEFVKRYGDKYSFAKVLPMKTYTVQTFGSVIDSFKNAVTVAGIIAVIITILISALFLILRGAKQYQECATLRAIGFSLYDMKRQYLYKMSIVSAIGIVIGVIMANTLGESMISLVLNMMSLGIAKFEFMINPWMNFIVCPLIIMAAALVVTSLCADRIKNYKLMTMIRE